MERIPLDMTEEVADARSENLPVLALESTIISHGMPYPENVETALRVEEIARQEGAVPATIAIIEGRLKVGLTHDDIDRIGRKGLEVAKASRRDIPLLVASNADGATTVAATMIIAALAGIRVFATGGIGGVHRGASTSFDISADLEELARTEVAVICAGVKSILDIGLTLEYLETRGVPVIGYKTDEMPAFYIPKSGFKLDLRVDSPDDIAEILHAQWSLGLGGGIVIAQPVQSELAMDEAIISKAIDSALSEADRQSIKGKDITPFLLAKISGITGGMSLKSNIALVENNVRLGAKTVTAYTALGR
ncbi:MAG: pseudouridine-5-phosphate glycosidase [Spirochaetes bacterium]|nr:MAG: pseudouridine-5-phosphate glycosidase [Spirochaetota bacterium]